MGTWGADYFQVKHQSQLQAVVNQFPSSLKRAMYAAAERNILHKGTWDGCAFNAAGSAVGSNVRSIGAASEVFDVNGSLVHRFITIWDSFAASEQGATRHLKRILLQAGLFTEPGEESVGRRFGRFVYTDKVFESDRSKFDEMMLANGISEADIEAAELLLVGTDS